MAVRLYADQSAYETYHGLTAGEAPATIDRLLRMASRVVDTLLVGRVYDTDADGYPTDADDAAALSDAVCAIAGEADAQGLAVAGSTDKWESVTIGAVSLSNLQGSSSDDTPRVAGLPVPPDAVLSLSGVGTVVVFHR